MSTVSGIYGRVKWPDNYTSHCYSWSMDVDMDTPEDTNWDTWDNDPDKRGWRSYVEGLREFSGSFECYQDEVPADFNFDVDEMTEIELYVDEENGNAWTGTAVCNSMSAESDIEDVQSVTVDFQGVLELNTL